MNQQTEPNETEHLKGLQATLDKLAGEIKQLRIENRDMLKKLVFLEKQNNLRKLADMARATRVDFEATITSPHIDDVDFVDSVFEVERHYQAETFKILGGADDSSGSSRERALPFSANSIMSGNYQKMLKRYFYAGKIFCEGKDVLDSCSGAGWGTFIISRYAKNIVAYDRDPDIVAQSRDHWPTDNVDWIAHDALAPLEDIGQTFDVVTSMEAIEHFTREEGEKYIEHHARVLRPGGIFIASSLFPYSDEQARTSPVLQMEGHKYLWTRQLMGKELEKHFSKVRLMSSWIVMAEK